MHSSSTADSAHVCTDPGKHWIETYFDPAYGPDRTGYAVQLAGRRVVLQAEDWRAAVAEARQIRFAAHLDAMCATATARVHQGILKAASAAYIALEIPPPDSHVIEVLLSIPGLAGIELTDAGGL